MVSRVLSDSEFRQYGNRELLDQEGPKRPALELLNEWLDKLEMIVNDAERKFAVDSMGFDR